MRKISSPIIKPYKVIIHIDNQKGQVIPISLEVDTGAAVSTLHKSLYDQFFPHFPLKSSSKKLINYDGTQSGGADETFKATLFFGGRRHQGTFHIVKNGKPSVLGRNFLNPLEVQINCDKEKTAILSDDGSLVFSEIAKGVLQLFEAMFVEWRRNGRNYLQERMENVYWTFA